ncbi:hypothetical protein CHU95_19925 [Niveispirillum lacus]|uniref:Uncharacterized protein n=1 Tax=Niveispirillum lacus TaxID=1981099 RepID=A0A255YQC1_9PROT|nr:hypothetical protein [Niveispirillum lacus]OYQ31422.1 hypothetical protein CHU95_19925 [Niveispirillum lacus]
MPAEIRLPYLTPETSAAEIDKRLAAMGFQSLRSADIAAAASRSPQPAPGQNFHVWVDAPADGAGIRVAMIPESDGGYVLREISHEADTMGDQRLVPIALCPSAAAIMPPQVASGILDTVGLQIADVITYLEAAQAALRRRELSARKVVEATTVSIPTTDGRFVDLYIARASPFRCWWVAQIVDTPAATPCQIVMRTRRGTVRTISIEDGRRTRHQRAAA